MPQNASQCWYNVYTYPRDHQKKQNYILELNPRGQVAPQVYVDNCDATNWAEWEGGAAVAT